MDRRQVRQAAVAFRARNIRTDFVNRCPGTGVYRDHGLTKDGDS